MLVVFTLNGCSLFKGNEKVKTTAETEKLSIPPTLNQPKLYQPKPQKTVQKPVVYNKPATVKAVTRKVVTSSPTVSKPVIAKPVVQPNKKYFIVVDTFPSQNQALDLFARLSSMGISNTAMESRKTNQGQTLHMVRVGPLNQTEINETKNALTADGLSQFKIVEN